MELDLIWKAILIVVAGTLLLRIAGRKSISQMTLAQTVIMIGIGSLLIQPVAGENIWMTLAVGGVLILTLIVIEYAQIKGDFFETLITGKSKVVIENGILQEKNLKKLRLTVDQLEMNLRQQNVMKVSDVQWATLEPNGQIGYVLKQDAQPVTKKEFQQLADNIQQTLNQLNSVMELTQLKEQLNLLNNQLSESSNHEDLFAEVKQQRHDTNPPKHLQ
ncbi:DUF421 domain-containing protein [Virgibacillus profundi]|uniref:DUF421 domain-containing protein n=1 Tax=Virgibacillus profundi TaxID=2024555 RepID=A0A2A2IK26_9BACI|nr:DUF421 domain-containing protein [Virgibacillus profundi]PAV31510.1 DUF421 domain-containing protein [Virgibacillus profundi]PXY55696.1 DUF421 domain-containing protein [Virgibacillus profundi]